MCQVVKSKLVGFGEAKEIVEKINGINIPGLGDKKNLVDASYDDLNLLFVAFNYQDKDALKEAISFMNDKSNPNNRVIGIVLNCDKNPAKELEGSADLFYTSNRDMEYGEEDLLNIYKSVLSIVNTSTLINIDYNDFCTVTGYKQELIVGTGEAIGAYRANKAAEMAVSKLGNRNLTDILVSVSANESISLIEISRAIDVIRDNLGGDINILFGTAVDANMNSFRVTILASV